RALAVGDSSVYGFGNDDDEVFTSILESRLPADFVNAAVPGYSTFQVINQLRGRTLALDPDLLLVATLWSDNNFDSFSDKDLLASYAGWTDSPGGRVRVLLEHSALFRRLDWHLRVAPLGARAQKVGWQVGGDDPRTGNRRVALADYARNLDTLCSIMANRDGGVVHVMLANREDIAAVSHDPAWGPYRDAMREAARRCDAPLVDLPAAFKASGHSADALFLDLMHPTALGHRVMAEAIEAQLVALGWPQQPILAHPSDAPLATPPDRFEGKGTVAEAAAHKSAHLDLDLRAAAYPLWVDLRDAAGGPALGSNPASGPGTVRVKLAARPSRVIVGVTLDRGNDGPGEGDPHVDIGPLDVPAAGALVVEVPGSLR
ncbi:MAG: hypothetical protein FJ102_27385, partial [Deltaproteobacteria bacterium]|nr:hypothetical protein [Deltaproteobacteria bacterium]